MAGFSHVDGTVDFYTQISAVLRPTDYVLDFGAGRGEEQYDYVSYRRELSNLKGRCAHVDGCDVDDVVLENPFLDEAKVLSPGAPLPYPDERFDIVIAQWVFEHINDPKATARELLRVVKPRGLIAAVTPNKYGFIGLAARAVPNKHHIRALKAIQPDRKAADVFPTLYRMNSPSALRKAFGEGVDLYVSRRASEPSYHFGRPAVFRAAKWLEKHLPDILQPTLFVYIRKR